MHLCRYISYILILILGAVSLPHQGYSQGVKSETTGPAGIVVSGECLAKVVQDRGNVVIASTTVAKNTKDASEKVITAHERLKKAVKGLNLKDFIAETAGYSVDQECTYENGKRKCVGFRARLATRFETSEIGRLGDIIAISSEQGSEEVSNLNTFASPETLKKAREACLEIAMKNAASKATILAQGAGVTLGKLRLVQEGMSHNSHRPMPMGKRVFEAAAMSEMTAPSPSIDSRPLDLRVEITAHYEIN